MKTFDEWRFPDREEHLQEWMTKQQQMRHGRLCYQAHKYDEALKHCARREIAVDVGAHVGLWSWLMVHDFQHVHVFEPMALHRECFIANIPQNNVTLYDFALGEKVDSVNVVTRTKDSSGDTGISGKGEIPMRPLDSFGLEIDFIKIDCEGYETNVLKGAQETLLRCKPVILVEQKGNMSEQYGLPKMSACKFLESLGAVKVGEISGDYIYKWA